MIIYLIQGETGEYEDRFTWVNKAFTSKQLAQSIMDSMDNTDTFYRLIELELITDPFMESVLSTTKD